MPFFSLGKSSTRSTREFEINRFWSLCSTKSNRDPSIDIVLCDTFIQGGINLAYLGTACGSPAYAAPVRKALLGYETIFSV